ncbi:MAG: cell division protein ZapA [Bacillaceae bacterium]|nr:cell division protein ZapA [Bacillaceae bacterium]
MAEDDKKRLTVEIYGQSYRIKGYTSVNHIRTVAGFVDDKMREIAETNPKLDTTRIAVLSAINIADEYFRLKEEYEKLLREKEAAQPGKERKSI